jgi:hypothetical protein
LVPGFRSCIPVGFATGMHELQFAFSLAGLTGARPLPEFYYLIYLTSGFTGLVLLL